MHSKAGQSGPLPIPNPVVPAARPGVTNATLGARRGSPQAMPFPPLTLLDRFWDARREFTYVERGKMASMGTFSV